MPRNLDYLNSILQFKNFLCCEKCRKDCKVDPVLCNVCCKWFHRKCDKGKALMSKKSYIEYQERNNFICSNKCYNSVLPFFTVDNIGVISSFLGDGEKICKKCKRDCVQTHIECSGSQCTQCQSWYHKSCTNENSQSFICSTKCLVKTLPFSSISTSDLVDCNIVFPNLTLCTTQVNKDDPSPSDNPVDSNHFINIDHFLNINCSYIDDRPK